MFDAMGHLKHTNRSKKKQAPHKHERVVKC